MSKHKIYIPLLIVSLVMIHLCTQSNAKITYDAEFWEGFEDNLAPYEHNWTNIPDFVDIPNV